VRGVGYKVVAPPVPGQAGTPEGQQGMEAP